MSDQPGKAQVVNTRKPWYYYLWDSFGKPPAGEYSMGLWVVDLAYEAERRLLRKLDASLLVFSVLGLIMRYVDQTNLATACECPCAH